MLYDVRCDVCNQVVERRRSSYVEAESEPCVCGGKVQIIITQVNLSPDAIPTRSWKFANAPTPVRSDGTAINPGHEPITAASLRLTHDQAKRLDL